MRVRRQGETKFKLWTAALFYRSLSRITSVSIPQDTGDFRLMSLRRADSMRRLSEHHRFMRGLSAWIGFRQNWRRVCPSRTLRRGDQVPDQEDGQARDRRDDELLTCSAPTRDDVRLLSRPCSLVGIVLAVALRLLNQTVVGQATTLVSVLFLGGVQLIFLGVIGEYIGRIYDETKRRPLYLTWETLGFEGAPPRHPCCGCPADVAPDQ